MTFNNVIQLFNLKDKVHLKGGAVDTWKNYKAELASQLAELALQLRMESRVVGNGGNSRSALTSSVFISLTVFLVAMNNLCIKELILVLWRIM